MNRTVLLRLALAAVLAAPFSARGAEEPKPAPAADTKPADTKADEARPEAKEPKVAEPKAAEQKPADTKPTAKTGELTPVGRWKTIDDNTGKAKSIVEIYEEGSKLHGKIVKLLDAPPDDPDPKCIKCEGDLKDKPIAGMRILWDLKKDGDEWSGGRILDPENGKTYKCYIAVVEDGKKLKVRGYVGFALLGRTQYWHQAP